ncbi:MAG: NAD(P)-binding protein [Pseudomonadota bacterium]
MADDATQNYDAIVIGSGLGGLTSGALAARAGWRVLLLERNNGFGGAASTYVRGGLKIEASLHETTHPSSLTDPKHDVFRALDLDTDVDFVPVGDFMEVRGGPVGAPLALPHGLGAIESRLAARFPEEARNIKLFLRRIARTHAAMEIMGDAHGPLWKASHASELPIDLWTLIRDFKSSLSDVMRRHFGDNEALKIALAANLGYYTDDPDTFWWLGYAMAQGGYLREGGYYIKGGSQTLSDRLAEIIREEGGETLTNADATGVDIGPEGAVAGVRFRVGDAEERASAPVVFANASPHAITGMLPAGAAALMASPFENRKLSTSIFTVTFGLDRPAADFGVASYSTVLVPDWIERLSDYKEASRLTAAPPADRLSPLTVVDYARIDSGLIEEQAGQPLHPLSVAFADRFDNWRGLDADAARTRKVEWVEAILKRLDAEWPGIAAAVRQTSSASPVDMRNYLGTPDGAIYGFELAVPKDAPKGPPLQVKTPIDGLYIASSFAGFGGFTGAMGAGAAAAKAAMAGRS